MKIFISLKQIFNDEGGLKGGEGGWSPTKFVFKSKNINMDNEKKKRKKIQKKNLAPPITRASGIFTTIFTLKNTGIGGVPAFLTFLAFFSLSICIF